jgi:hypothetical protein
MSLEDVAYYQRRALEERRRAKNADSPEAAQAHSDLAELYEGLVSRAGMLPTRREIENHSL